MGLSCCRVQEHHAAQLKGKFSLLKLHVQDLCACLHPVSSSTVDTSSHLGILPVLLFGLLEVDGASFIVLQIIIVGFFKELLVVETGTSGLPNA